MSQLFYGLTSFNSDIHQWNVSKVTDMSKMFSCDVTNDYDCQEMLFHGDLSKWDVSNVTDMSGMFFGASYFHFDMSRWDVSNVHDMSDMFYRASSFNSDISQWDVTNVTSMSHMFYSASSFNSNLSQWNASKVSNMNHMFYNASSFDVDHFLFQYNASQSLDALFDETPSKPRSTSNNPMKVLFSIVCCLLVFSVLLNILRRGLALNETEDSDRNTNTTLRNQPTQQINEPRLNEQERQKREDLILQSVLLQKVQDTVYSDDINMHSCTICLDTYKKDDDICTSLNGQCSHIFHFKCIQGWLLTRDSCPMCRVNYLCEDIELGEIISDNDSDNDSPVSNREVEVTISDSPILR